MRMTTLLAALAMGLATSLPAVAQTAALSSFTLTPDAAIAGYNREQLGAVTPEACAAACLATPRNAWCVSFDYHKATQKCDLSDARAADVGGLKTD